MERKMAANIIDEFKGVSFGDQRLDKRLLKIAKQMSYKPEESICAANTCPHECKATYRFFANEKVTSSKITQQHIESSLERAQKSNQSLLMIHDTTELIYTKFSSIKNLETLTTKAGMKQGVRGIRLHNSLLASESGIPLGIIKQSFFSYEEYTRRRGQNQRNMKGSHKNYAIEQKGSWRWIEHLRETENRCSNLKKEIIHVADREGDIYEFLQESEEIEAKYVIRLKSNRRIKIINSVKQSITTIEKELEKAESLGTIGLEVKTPKGKKENHDIILKSITVTLHCPERKIESMEIGPLKPLVVNIVEARSLQDPEFGWHLITNMRCACIDQAERVVEIYKKRWLIETYHRSLKSGYRVEKARLSTRSRLEKLCSLLSILAWRIMWLYTSSRDAPEMNSLSLLSTPELKVLQFSKYNKNNKTKKLNAKQSIFIIAKMGGFLGRKSDGLPGMTSIWKGLKALYQKMEFLEEITYG